MMMMLISDRPHASHRSFFLCVVKYTSAISVLFHTNPVELSDYE